MVEVLVVSEAAQEEALVVADLEVASEEADSLVEALVEAGSLLVQNKKTLSFLQDSVSMIFDFIFYFLRIYTLIGTPLKSK